MEQENGDQVRAKGGKADGQPGPNKQVAPEKEIFNVEDNEEQMEQEKMEQEKIEQENGDQVRAKGGKADGQAGPNKQVAPEKDIFNVEDNEEQMEQEKMEQEKMEQENGDRASAEVLNGDQVRAKGGKANGQTGPNKQVAPEKEIINVEDNEEQMEQDLEGSQNDQKEVEVIHIDDDDTESESNGQFDLKAYIDLKCEQAAEKMNQIKDRQESTKECCKVIVKQLERIPKLERNLMRMKQNFATVLAKMDELQSMIREVKELKNEAHNAEMQNNPRN